MIPKAAIFCRKGADCPDLNRIFGPHQRARMKACAALYPEVVTPQNLSSHAANLRDVEVIFATWGMWELSGEELRALPNLKAVFYGAGSVRIFAWPLLAREILVTSAWAANAVPVAEFTLAQILLANKGYYRNMTEFRGGGRLEAMFRGQGNYGASVAILGAGQIGRKLIELLRPFHLRVLCYDPYLSQKGAELLGVEKIESLEEAFRRGDVVSNHIADTPATVGLITGSHFSMLPHNAVFINTGRGTTVRAEEFLSAMMSRPDLTALLDVTEPEPLPLNHPLRALPNVYISGHIAGSIGAELERMGDLALDEFERWRTGQPLRYAVTPAMLETMA